MQNSTKTNVCGISLSLYLETERLSKIATLHLSLAMSDCTNQAISSIDELENN